jgi:hypothetical protein
VTTKPFWINGFAVEKAADAGADARAVRLVSEWLPTALGGDGMGVPSPENFTKTLT